MRFDLGARRLPRNNPAHRCQERLTPDQAALLLESATLTGCHRKGTSSFAFNVSDPHARVLFEVVLSIPGSFGGKNGPHPLSVFRRIDAGQRRMIDDHHADAEAVAERA